MQKALEILPDAIIVAGAGLVSYGAWLMIPAVGFVVAGVLAIAGGLVAAHNANKKAPG